MSGFKIFLSITYESTAFILTVNIQSSILQESDGSDYYHLLLLVCWSHRGHDLEKKLVFLSVDCLRFGRYISIKLNANSELMNI